MTNRINPYVLVPGPEDIDASHHFMGCFDRYEREVSAWFIVRYAQQQGNWNPFTKAEIDTFAKEDFWFNGLNDGAHIIEENGLFHVTLAFISKLPRRS